jgi:hypothetical protein
MQAFWDIARSWVKTMDAGGLAHLPPTWVDRHGTTLMPPTGAFRSDAPTRDRPAGPLWNRALEYHNRQGIRGRLIGWGFPDEEQARLTEERDGHTDPAINLGELSPNRVMSRYGSADGRIRETFAQLDREFWVEWILHATQW